MNMLSLYDRLFKHFKKRIAYIRTTQPRAHFSSLEEIIETIISIEAVLEVLQPFDAFIRISSNTVRLRTSLSPSLSHF